MYIKEDYEKRTYSWRNNKRKGEEEEEEKQ